MDVPWEDLVARFRQKTLLKLSKTYPESGLVARMLSIKKNSYTIIEDLRLIIRFAEEHNIAGGDDVETTATARIAERNLEGQRLMNHYHNLRSRLALRCRGERLSSDTFSFQDAKLLLERTRNELSSPNILIARAEDGMLHKIISRKVRILE